ncbi:argininosuccinate lyase [Lentilitoribacter sp. Alg239-R112]|uniref:argininosuccinate lyase n=1 Tax=Lentilitoribacter sp. Alg239-R112 TaxID=2305987 RepID=UPI0013A6EB7F|nr:argininosuccinate lyase [Lentilitoribacter sp. Alg239-R112]
MIDTSKFPNPIYKETVLAPLFEGVKNHYASHMSKINKAHLVMLVETGILSNDQGKIIADALSKIDKDTDIPSLTYTGEHEDYFFFVEARLRDLLGDLGGALHTARSRNDMDHTLFKIALRTRAETMLVQVLQLTDALIEKASKEHKTPIVAYTHGQPAQPSTFGHYLGAMIEVLIRDATRLETAINDLSHCPMGAAAITTSGFPIDRERMADLLGFDGPLVNSYGCIASVDYITGLYSAIKLVFIHLGRVIQDLAFWSAFEVSQLYVPNELVQISSIMPQKRNPVPIEHMRHLASVTVGRCDTIVNTMHNTPYTDMNDSEGEVQQAGYVTFESGSRVLELLTAFLPACSINADAVQRNTDAACITITELADTLVRDENLTFRQAHEIAAATAKSVIAQNKPLREGYDAFIKAFEAEEGRKTHISDDTFRNIVSVENFIAKRDRTGGPAPIALNTALKSYTNQTSQLHMKQIQRHTKRSDAQARLDVAFSSLMEH